MITSSRARSAAALTAAGLIITAVAACAPAATSPAPPAPAASVAPLPGTHVHGLAVNDRTGQLLLATHEGLFDISRMPAVRIGPENDLMGFTAGHDDGTFYASGHPGHDSTLPNPLGLIRSGDGGRTWDPVSRQRESDFHALTTTKSGIVAFDGTLMTSTDGKNWTTVAAGFSPAVLAGAGVVTSADGGGTFTPYRPG